MRKKLLTLVTIVLLTLTASSAKAQYYCFFVDNQSDEAFYELKIRPTGTSMAFSEDRLSGHHKWHICRWLFLPKNVFHLQ